MKSRYIKVCYFLHFQTVCLFMYDDPEHDRPVHLTSLLHTSLFCEKRKLCEKLPSILNVIMGDDVTKVDKDKRENANSMKVCRDYTFTSYSYYCTGRGRRP